MERLTRSLQPAATNSHPTRPRPQPPQPHPQAGQADSAQPGPASPFQPCYKHFKVVPVLDSSWETRLTQYQASPTPTRSRRENAPTRQGFPFRLDPCPGLSPDPDLGENLTQRTDCQADPRPAAHDCTGGGSSARKGHPTPQQRCPGAALGWTPGIPGPRRASGLAQSARELCLGVGGDSLQEASICLREVREVLT